MIRLGKSTFRRLLNGVRVIAQGRPKCVQLVWPLVAGKKGIEIGGPSQVFRRWINLPIYEKVLSLDNCDFSQNTTWASHEQAYRFSDRKECGKTYFCEGSNLQDVKDDQYDFLLSSHNLEHLANPIKGLKEWQRVVKPGGHLIIVLPHHARTFDHRRAVTPVQHMVSDYENNTGEDDLTHVEETFQAHRLNDPTRSDSELRQLLMSNFSHRMMHHHVFDESNSRELLETVGFKVLAVETQLPFHIYLVAQTPLV